MTKLTVTLIVAGVLAGSAAAWAGESPQTATERKQLFSGNFQAGPAHQWKFVGGKWAVRDGRLEQTDSDPADPKKAILMVADDDDAATAVTITVKLRLQNHDSKSRAGISVCSDTENAHGLNLVFYQDKLQFLHDFTAWGPSCQFRCEPGKWYWMKLWKTKTWGAMRGKAWADGEKEPAGWMVTWQDYAKGLTGYPGLNGGCYEGNAVSFGHLKVEIDKSQGVNSEAVELQVLPAQSERLPLLLDQFGPAARKPCAVVTVAGTALPKGEFALTGYRGGREVKRESLSWEAEKPWIARLELAPDLEEVALRFKADRGQEQEIHRQPVPKTDGAARGPWGAQGRNRVAAAAPQDILLSGSDWKLASFEMGKGEKAQAYRPEFDDSHFRTVKVPGEVPLQLGLKGPELYFQSRELTLTNEKEWWYRKRFTTPKDAQGKVVRLVFDGADYFSTVWLNGEKLGEHEGCFVPFTSFDVSGRLRPEEDNLLAVKVTCPWLPKDRAFQEYLKGEWTMVLDSLRISAPAKVLGPSWDGVPALGNAVFPMGLFRDVKLAVSGELAINDLYVQTQSLNADGSATLIVSGNVLNYGDKDTRATLDWKLEPENFVGDPIALPFQNLSLRPGENRFSVRLEVKHPRLWWTWDTGEQNLYKLSANLSASGSRSSLQKIFGIRTIERHEDMSYWLNGRRLFLKGAWYISDLYLSRRTRFEYEKDLELYKACNLNHLVNFTLVDGSDFYDQCDRLGILNMFEFPFMQFGPLDALDSPRREVYVRESLSQLRHVMLQVRNHPSIILWAPFAEVLMMKKDSYKEYGYLGRIARLVEELAPGSIFHSSFCDAGENHFWEWGFGGDYRAHFEAKAAFVSEYGCTAVPAIETLRTMLTPEELWSENNTLRPKMLAVPIDVPVWAYYSPREYCSSVGLAKMLGQINRIDRQPRSLQELIDASQLSQAFLFQYATEAYRRKKYDPINGVRIWCYSDLAPRIGWGFIDYYAVPKMAYYYLKKAHERFALNFAFANALEPQAPGKPLKIPVWVINDYCREIPVTAQCGIYDLKGRKVWEKEFSGTVAGDGKTELGAVEWTPPASTAVYVLRGKAVERGGENLIAQGSNFILVEPPLVPPEPATNNDPASLTAAEPVSTPPRMPTKELTAPLRVLLIGQSHFGAPIAKWLTEAGVKVNAITESSVDMFGLLREPEALRNDYDVVWLCSFDSLWKLMDDEMARGLGRAVELGLGFIHTGGEGSFHGGNGRGAMLDFRALADVLPVKLRNRNDVALDWFADVKDVRPAEGVSDGSLAAVLRESGVGGFNLVELKAGAQPILTVCAHPLLVAGKYGQGRTAAFMGFTPGSTEMPSAYGELFMRLLAEVGGEKLRAAYDRLAACREPEPRQAIEPAGGKTPDAASDGGEPIPKPLFQCLKELPEATLTLPKDLNVRVPGRRAKSVLKITNGGNYARLVRMRVEWDGSESQTPFILYSDNYLDLLPQESTEINLEFLLPENQPAKASGWLIVEGANVKARKIPINVSSN